MPLPLLAAQAGIEGALGVGKLVAGLLGKKQKPQPAPRHKSTSGILGLLAAEQANNLAAWGDPVVYQQLSNPYYAHAIGAGSLYDDKSLQANAGDISSMISSRASGGGYGGGSGYGGGMFSSGAIAPNVIKNKEALRAAANLLTARNPGYGYGGGMFPMGTTGGWGTGGGNFGGYTRGYGGPLAV